MMRPDEVPGRSRERQYSDINLVQQEQPHRSLKRSSTMPELGACPGLTVQPPTPLDMTFGKQHGHPMHAEAEQGPVDTGSLFVGSYRSNASSVFPSGEDSALEDDDAYQRSPAASYDLTASPLSVHAMIRSSASPTPSSVSAPSSRRGSKAKSKQSAEDDQPKRPLNSFMLYRKDKWPTVPNKNHQSISRIIGEMWRNESRETKERYDSLAKQAKANHQALYPGYKFHPKKKKDGKTTSAKTGTPYRQSGSVSDSGVPPAMYSHEDYMRHVQPPFPYGYYPLQPDRSMYGASASTSHLFPTASEARASLAMQQQRSQQGYYAQAPPFRVDTPPRSTTGHSSSDQESPWSVPTAESALRQHHLQVQRRRQQLEEARTLADAEAQAQLDLQHYEWMQAQQTQQAQQQAMQMHQQQQMLPPQELPGHLSGVSSHGVNTPHENLAEPQYDLLSNEYGVPEFMDEHGQIHPMAGLLDLAIYDPNYDGLAAFGPAQGQWSSTTLYDGTGDFGFSDYEHTHGEER